MIEHELLPVGQHPLGGEAPLGEQEGTAVGAEGRSSPIQQVAVVFCGPQLDPTGFGRAVALRLGAGQGDNHPKRTDTVRLAPATSWWLKLGSRQPDRPTQ